MKFGKEKSKEIQEKVKKILQEKQDKAEAISEAVEILAEEKYADLIEQLKEEQEKSKADEQYAKKLNLRVLSEEEKEFYQKLVAEQSVTGDLVEAMPTSIMDYTLEDVRTQESGIMKLIDLAPADVKRWFTAEKSGTFAWGKVTDSIKGELEVLLKELNIELGKLTVYLVIPKAIRDLRVEFIDKYFMAILQEALIDGIEYAYCQGNGKEMPIGIYKQIDKSTDGVHEDKEVNANLTAFTPKALAPVKKSITKHGKRKYNKLYVVCHPDDNADYVTPALYDEEGNLVSSVKNIEIIESAQNPIGKAAITIEKKYAMGFSGFKVDEYKETKALDDADLLIGKVYANGRAVDDNVAFVFDVTKLEEYIPKVKVVNAQEVAEA